MYTGEGAEAGGGRGRRASRQLDRAALLESTPPPDKLACAAFKEPFSNGGKSGGKGSKGVPCAVLCWVLLELACGGRARASLLLSPLLLLLL